MKTELERLNARNHLTEAILEYCRVFFNDSDKEYNERFVAGVMAFLQINYYKDMYMPVMEVELGDDEPQPSKLERISKAIVGIWKSVKKVVKE